MDNENYNSPLSDAHIVLICVTMVLSAFIVNLFFIFTEPHKESNESVKVISETSYAPETEPPAILPTGFYPEHVYRVGDKSVPAEYYMPAGYYMIIANDNYDHSACWSVVNQNSDSINLWFQYSNIVRLENGWNFNMTMCDAYSLDTFDGENNPFEHPGMFRIGIDVPAGTYRIIPTTDQHYEAWAVHENIESVDYEEINRSTYDKTDEDIEVTLKEGNILELRFCIFGEN